MTIPDNEVIESWKRLEYEPMEGTNQQRGGFEKQDIHSITYCDK